MIEPAIAEPAAPAPRRQARHERLVRVGRLGRIWCVSCSICGREVIVQSVSRRRGACRLCAADHEPRESATRTEDEQHLLDVLARRKAAREAIAAEEQAKASKKAPPPDTLTSELGLVLEQHLAAAEASVERIRRIFEGEGA